MKGTTAAVLVMLLYSITICFGVYVTECGWWLLLFCLLDIKAGNKDDKEESK